MLNLTETVETSGPSKALQSPGRLVNSREKREKRKPEGVGDERRGQEIQEKVMKQQQQQRGLRQCVRDRRCVEVILTVRVGRLHNVWAASTNLLRPVAASRRPALST